MPFAWAAGAAAIGGIGAAVIGSQGAQSAAQTQANAANQAGQVQQNMFNKTQQNLSPYMQTGGAANQVLQGQLGISAGTNGGPATFDPNAPLSRSMPGFTSQGAFSAPGFQAGPAFNAPQYNPLTAQTFQQGPGYQYELQQQQQAIQNSAAASGGAIGGNTLMALQQNAQGLASQDWFKANALNQSSFQTGFDASLAGWQANQGANVQNYNTQFNSALSGYQENQSAGVQDYNTNYDANRGNQNYLLSALNGQAGSGQNAAAQLGGFGQQSASAQGDYLTQAGNATAAGQIGTSNAIGNGLGGALNTFGGYAMNQYGNGGGMFGSSGGYDPSVWGG